ncbi:pyridoxamine 5'-phosphate oxidase family protein, partial [Methylobacterium sp. WL18]|uniref:pyridoxamine 5'-phosphate oxidase family protein n=1 Tax=Methylobacterium sp. WL18 TaxID=2603897 RepID=UPI001FED88F1
MTRAPLPAFYDDLDASFAELWRLLADGAAQGRSGFHLPALATLGPDGPRLRTVVLRAADAESGILRFHCDRRSDKAAEIRANPACALAAYDEALRFDPRDADAQANRSLVARMVAEVVACPFSAGAEQRDRLAVAAGLVQGGGAPGRIDDQVGGEPRQAERHQQPPEPGAGLRDGEQG